MRKGYCTTGEEEEEDREAGGPAGGRDGTLGCLQGADGAARAMHMHLDTATQHICYYLGLIRDSTDMRRTVLLKHADMLETRRAASAPVEVGGAGADESNPINRQCFVEALVTVAKMYRNKHELNPRPSDGLLGRPRPIAPAPPSAPPIPHMPDSLSRRLQSARVADGRRSGSATIASAQMVRAMDPSPVCTTSGGAEPHRGARMEPQRAKMFATPMARPRMRMGKISAGSM
mmetsp:Transcript_813/g.2483  ORF Transcript_813/g.2483 Transcript_813/m.2483 type:complete len:232 (+) Transcript_813:2695-3390(+)